MISPPLKALSFIHNFPPHVRADFGRTSLITVMALRFLEGLRLSTSLSYAIYKIKSASNIFATPDTVIPSNN